MIRRTILLRLAVAVFLIGYLFWFAGAGIGAQFTDNDLMNLSFHLTPSFGKLLWSNVTYWSSMYRPMGGVVYAASYRLFGFSPLPLRIICFGLILVNLFLLYRVVVRLTDSAEAALLATLLVTYHAWFVDLYYSSGTIYELLCYAFYCGAFYYYLTIRQSGRMPNSRQWLIFLALYVAGLDSKELAVTLPLCIGVYECLWHSNWRAKAAAPLKGMLLSAAITVPYVIGKLTGPESLAANPLYRPEISFSRYIHTLDLYLNVLFYQDHFFRPGKTIILLVLMLGLALWQRSRPMLFAWSFAFFSVLPFIFVPHYSGFFMYLPAAGWAIYMAVALAMLRRRLAPRLPAAVVFLAVAAILAPMHTVMSRKTMRVFTSAELPTRTMIAELRRVQPALPRGARVLFQNDPFPPRTYWLAFLVQLFYDDPGIQVSRAKDGVAWNARKYDAVFGWVEGKLVRLAGSSEVGQAAPRPGGLPRF